MDVWKWQAPISYAYPTNQQYTIQYDGNTYGTYTIPWQDLHNYPKVQDDILTKDQMDHLNALFENAFGDVFLDNEEMSLINDEFPEEERFAMATLVRELKKFWENTE